MAKTELKQIKIKLVKSLIGASEKQRRVVAGLGLTKQNQVVEHYFRYGKQSTSFS